MVESSIVNCGVCDHEFDNGERPPMLLTCGHTFCLTCIRQFERSNGAILCPNCRGADYRQISQLKKNIQLVPLVDKDRKSPDVPCPTHPNVESSLYCLDCQLSFCAKCVSQHKRHELYSVSDQVITCNTTERVDVVKKRLESELEEAKQAAKRCQSLMEAIENGKSDVKRQIGAAFEPVMAAIQQKQEELANVHCRKFTGIITKLKSATESVDDVLRKRQKVSELSFALNSKLQRTAGTERLKYVAQMEALDSNAPLLDVTQLENEVKNFSIEKVQVDVSEIVRSVKAIPVAKCEEIEEEKSPVRSVESSTKTTGNMIEMESLSGQRQLAIQLRQNYELSARIFEVLATTDRCEFMPAESVPYEDRPQKIGFNTTISAPHMHAITLRMLEDRLKPGIKVLDVGCGSGYLTVCLGKMIRQGKVFGLDHIEELVNQANENVQKSHYHILTSLEVEVRFVVGDGREGLSSEGPFDIIHIGASTPEVPPKLLEQLALGGRMMLPLGPQNSFQQIVIIDKGLDGQLSRKALINVNYAPLIERQRQCP